MDWKELAKTCWDEVAGILYNLDYLTARDNKSCHMEFDIVGDWKHAHAHFMQWLEDFCQKNNIKYSIDGCRVVGDDDDADDAFRAVYQITMSI